MGSGSSAEMPIRLFRSGGLKYSGHGCWGDGERYAIGHGSARTDHVGVRRGLGAAFCGGSGHRDDRGDAGHGHAGGLGAPWALRRAPGTAAAAGLLSPQHTSIILIDRELAGCVTVRPAEGRQCLEHFYLAPHCQGRGFGSAALRTVLERTDAQGMTVALNVLQGSAARGSPGPDRRHHDAPTGGGGEHACESLTRGARNCLLRPYGTARSTVSRAIGEIRPLLAARGFAVPDRLEVRLRTLADVFAYAEAEGIRLRIDGAETQVRRPKANRPGRRAFVSGNKKRNNPTCMCAERSSSNPVPGVGPTCDEGSQKSEVLEPLLFLGRSGSIRPRLRLHTQLGLMPVRFWGSVS